MATTDTPRRIRMDSWSPGERAIHDAVQVVEAMGADPRLTDAVVLLQAARDSVADYMDSVDLATQRVVRTVARG